MGHFIFPCSEELDIRERTGFQRLKRESVSKPGIGFLFPESQTAVLTIPSSQVNGNIYELAMLVRFYSDGTQASE